ncbi:TonB-dependent receptor [Erythrobacteraceae bacterium CFH 75059]|uniref:TonB-dependent receptor n=1 Tax=Qipengyuania thermophila TaxID=2509361 RepID=UPI0010202B47|nr:TonB-dependent receptor [Qipengyuania thermophila]TCD06513.1 TonB-dependent receptor [Erythrobacteraceae bacterium CFH 75059]
MKLAAVSFRAFALAGAGIGLIAAPAAAQDTRTDTAQRQQTTPGSTTPSPLESGSVDQDNTNVIIVTAQGRAQALADVPVAVSAITASTLQNSGTTDIRELNQVAPSLLVSSTSNEANGSARIRGIGTVGDNPGLESSVAVFIDGVYRSRSGSALSELGPLDRIEILRGPQGTLGGRNSSAGLISIYTAPPTFDFNGYGAFTYGNFDAIRVEAGVNAPFGETVAARVDGVYFKRDGFYTDLVNNTDINNRDRIFVRGQLLFEPTDDVRFRLIGDYAKRNEACCAATFVQPEFAPLARVAPGLNSFVRPEGGAPLTSTSNPIIPVLLALGQDRRALTQSTFNRNLYLTPGRSYEGETKDYGVSGELTWSFGGATLTSITGYREYDNFQGSDTDYTTVDLLYRAPNRFGGARQFKTFTQELRLSGSLFDDRLDWLVGGYYANERLQVRDNLRFGRQYGTFASCRIALAINPALVNPAAPNCLGANVAALTAANGGAGAFGPATPLIIAGINNLAQVNDRGSNGDIYNQRSENFALFTHNIFSITDTVDLTLGLRYTNETKTLDALITNDNTFCPANRALLGSLLTNPALGALTQGIVGLTCQGNSTSELNNRTLADRRSEDEFTGTAILSWKPTPDLLTYASYSRGYKAGGFNLDRSALANPPFFNPAAINVAALQFDQETVNAYEIGLKYATRPLSISLAAFRQEFSNFQLNTFNGSVFVVQNVNACGTALGGADRDASATTGACSPDDVRAGVIAQGVEAEIALNPVRDLAVSLGFTYSDTKYRNDLIGNATGAPLDPALRLLPGDNLSNAPEITATSSITFTPEIVPGGARGLFFLNARMTSDYNTGSDLLFGKEQDGFVVVNGRVGITNIAGRFAIEGWVQNLFNTDYTQVAFNTPFVAPQQTFSAFLAEPRTYGITVRAEF